MLRHPPAGPLRARGVVTALVAGLLAPLLMLLLMLALGGALVGVADAQAPQAAAGAPSSAGSQRSPRPPAGRAPGGRLSDPVVRAVDVAAPAVVRIATLYDSHITLNFCGETISLPHGSTGYSEGVLGSGAFVSAHGDILTADHVVDVDHDTLEQQLLADPVAQADIATALNNSTCFGFGPAIGAGDIANGFLQMSGIDYTTTFDAPKSYVWRDTWFSGQLASQTGDTSDVLKALMSAPHEQASILASSDFAHDDLAALHVNEQNTPSIQLDDSTSVQALDTLTIIGFPGNGDANNDPSNLLTPSFNLASVSAIKSNTDGSELIQVGGNIEHGDSGGPALDASGRIVGVVSFGGPDNQGITAFLRSSDSARRLLARAKVDTHPGDFEVAWQRAFSDYAATYPGHWRRSSRELAALLKAYPQFKGAQPYASWAGAEARVEPAPQHRTTLTPLMEAILAALAALALALIGVTLFRTGRDGAPPRRHTVAIAYPAPPREQPSGGALLDALDDGLTPTTRQMN